MSTDATLLRQRMMQVADEAITTANKWLASSSPRIEEEHDPEVLLLALIEQLTEYRYRMSPEDSESERRLRLSEMLHELTAYEQTLNRITLAERDGVGIYSEDQRALKASVERTVRGLRLAILLIVAADKESGRRERTTQGGIPE